MSQQAPPDDPFGELIAHNAAVQARQGRRRPARRAALAGFAVLFLAGLGLIGYGIAEKTSSKGTAATKPPLPTTAPHDTVRGVGGALTVTLRQVTTTTAPTTTAPTTTARPPRTVFVVHATRGDSWVELRIGTATGRVLYSGILRQGETTRASGRTLWVRFGSAANLDLALNGKPIHGVTGTLDATITPSGLQ
jgi:hypothetical protein